MFDFPDMGIPPHHEDHLDAADLLHDLLEGMVENIEKNAGNKAVRLGAGIALRSSKMHELTEELGKYALACDKLSVECLAEVRDRLDKMLVEANAIIEKYPISKN